MPKHKEEKIQTRHLVIYFLLNSADKNIARDVLGQ